MDAREVAEAIAEALASKGRASSIKTEGDRQAGFSIATAVDGFEGIKEFEITVEEREAASAP
jgi:hypothetical protein